MAYDQYADADPFEDERYIAHFQLLRQAIAENRPVKITISPIKTGSTWHLPVPPQRVKKV